MLPAELHLLMRHMEWADALVWTAVPALPAAHADPLTFERLYHIHAVQWAYLHIWREEPIDLPEASAFEDLHEVQAWGRAYYRHASAYVDTLEEGKLQRLVQFPWARHLAQGQAHPATLAETMLQITSHTTYHRGQVNAHLRALGGEPPLTDFIAWIWRGKPVAAWADSHDT